MNFLPISIRISDQQILIIGGGKVALHKIKLLKRFTNKFKVIAPSILDEIKSENGVEYIEKDYERSDLQGYLLAYAATDNHDLNHQVQEDAKDFRCLVNVADDSSFSDFVSPAIFIDNDLTISVGSDGKDVHSSIKMRDRLKNYVQNHKQ